MTPLCKRMLDELQLRNLSACTTRAYVGAVERFSKYFQKSPEKMGPEQVREYLLHLIREKESRPNTVMVNRSGLRFLYVCTLKQSWFEESVPEPKRRPLLPRVLGVEEVTRILDSTLNLRHWTILATWQRSTRQPYDAVKCNVSRSATSTASGWCCMSVKARAAFPARLGSPRRCWKDCAFTSEATGRRTGCSLPGRIPPHHSMTARFALCVLRQANGPASNIAFIRTCFAMPPPRICSMPAPTFARSRFCLDTPASRLRQDTFTSPSGDCKLSGARSMRSR